MATSAISVTLNEGSAPSTPAANKTVVYAKADGLVYSKDDAGAETLMSSGATGAVATDTIWDAAGDLAVGSGANTAAKLTKGAAGGHLAVINSVVTWNSGTSMPGSAVAGDRYWRTDLGMEFYYDGTRWLTTNIFTQVLGSWTNVSATTAENYTPARVEAMDMWLIDAIANMQAASGLSGSAYWNIECYSYTTAGSTLRATPSLISGTNAQHTRIVVAIDALAGTTVTAFSARAVKVSTPGNFIGGVMLSYRLVGT